MVYVEHPRYGTTPRHTGLDPDPDSEGVYLHWNTNFFTKKQMAFMRKFGVDPDLNEKGRSIPGTAVVANLSKQLPATVPVTHYYDIAKCCRDCKRLFIFYADEQKHWYEELGFSLNSDCVRCVPCRKNEQAIESLLQKYNRLVKEDALSIESEIELAECRLVLIDEGVFTLNQAEKIRSFLNRFEDCSEGVAIRERLEKIEDAAKE